MKIVFIGDLFLGGDLQNVNIEQVVKSCNLKEANKRVVNLAHNHIQDKGEEGIVETRLCSDRLGVTGIRSRKNTV
jgi:hypothetical protein